MEGIITAIKGLLEVLERMAGGKKRAQVVFYTILIIIIGLAIKPIWDNVSYILSKISIPSPIAVAIASVILLIVGFGAVFAVITIIAAIPAQFLRTALDSAFRIRLNDTFIGLLDILRKANKEGLNEAQISQLLTDTEFLYSRWTHSKTNVFVSWIVPSYFKKGASKWKLVSEDTEKEIGK